MLVVAKINEFEMTIYRKGDDNGFATPQYAFNEEHLKSHSISDIPGKIADNKQKLQEQIKEYFKNASIIVHPEFDKIHDLMGKGTSTVLTYFKNEENHQKVYADIKTFEDMVARWVNKRPLTFYNPTLQLRSILVFAI